MQSGMFSQARVIITLSLTIMRDLQYIKEEPIRCLEVEWSTLDHLMCIICNNETIIFKQLIELR